MTRKTYAEEEKKNAIFIKNKNEIKWGKLHQFVCESCNDFGWLKSNAIHNGGLICWRCRRKTISEKQKEHSLQKYGTEHPSKNKEVQKRRVDLTIAKFGIANLGGTKESQDKKRKTNLQKYGAENCFQSEEKKEKIRQTLLKKYGVDNINKLPQTTEKILKTKMKLYGTIGFVKTQHVYKNIKFDSSWELAYYIYCEDHNIKCERNKTIYFKYEHNKKVRTYWPDFITETGLVEIKGVHCTKDDKYTEKEKICKKNNIQIILGTNEIRPFISYINDTYGFNYLKQFRT